MNKSNVIKILKTQYEIYNQEFMTIFLGIFLFSFIFSGDMTKVPIFLILHTLYIYSIVFYVISIKNREKLMYLISGCSRKELYISEFIMHMSLSIVIILDSILISSLVYSLNNTFFININGLFLILSILNIYSCPLKLMTYFAEKQKDKSYIFPISYIIFFVLLISFGNYNISEEFLSSSNFIVFVFLYIVSLVIYLLFNRYSISNQDFKL